MRRPVKRDEISELLSRHAALEDVNDHDQGRFLSGWQCKTPWADELTKRLRYEQSAFSGSDYAYMEDDDAILARLTAFHVTTDYNSPEAIFAGAGSTPLLFTMCLQLREMGVDEVFYIPPLYFSLHASLRLLGIRARPVSGRHPYEEAFRANWPSGGKVLLLTDPVWYAGCSLRSEVVDQIAAWQANTGSLVIVDGSFQYLNWRYTHQEQSSRLDPSRTLRLICFTKALAFHGLRFAHLIMPTALRRDYAALYATMYGSSSTDSVAFARVAIAAMTDGQIPLGLADLVSKRHRALRERNIISAPWGPDAGYFVFERLRDPPPEEPLMNGSYFEQKRYPEFSRINLLSPHLGRICA